MTPSSYFTALIAKSFGLDRRNKRLTDASQEMSILREAEYYLGLGVWEHIDEVSELSVEYWSLRKLTKELEGYRERQLILNQELSDLYLRRNEVLKKTSEEERAMEDEKDQMMDRLMDLTEERDQIIRQARDLRRAHEAILTKIEVLREIPSSEDSISESQQREEDLKAEFRQLRKKRQEVANAIVAGDAEFDQHEAKLKKIKDAKKEKGADIFQRIGELNRELSTIRSSSGAIEVQIRQLLSEVGRYISRFDIKDPACAKVAQKEKSMVAVMRMLRQSIAMNHKLADFK
jgi:chromosome segregation ATPase